MKAVARAAHTADPRSVVPAVRPPLPPSVPTQSVLRAGPLPTTDRPQVLRESAKLMNHIFAPARSLLEDLEARQDEVIRQLDELNERLEQLLKDHASERLTAPAAVPAGE